MPEIQSLEDGEVTWPCWWEGTEAGPNRRRWRINEFPSVFVIDADGIIRAKEVEGKALDEVVDILVSQLEEKRASK
jgi:hypothetical protein